MVPLSIDREGKNIEPVVVTYDVMKLLRFNTTLQIKFRVRNPFVILKGVSDTLARWINEEARRSLSPIEDIGDLGIAGDKKFAHRSVHEASGVDAKGLASNE